MNDAYLVIDNDDCITVSEYGGGGNLLTLNKVVSDKSIEHASFFVLLCVNSHPEVFGVQIHSSDWAPYPLKNAKYRSTKETMNLLAVALEPMSLIRIWFHFTDMSFKLKEDNELELIASIPGSGRLTVAKTSDLIDDYAFEYDLIHSNFISNDGTWIDADHLLRAFLIILKKESGILQTLAASLNVNAIEELRTHHPETLAYLKASGCLESEGE